MLRSSGKAACTKRWTSSTEIGYNPTKPGRPSHTLHTYWIGNLRLVLDVEVQGGKAHAAKHSLPRLRGLLEGLAPEERPVLVRGDIGFGNERVMAEMEAIGQSYLFKLKQTPCLLYTSALTSAIGRYATWCRSSVR